LGIYIEKLTFWNLFQLFFCIFKIIYNSEIKDKIHISYIDGTFISEFLVQRIGILFDRKINKLSFELINIREEESGDLIRLLIPQVLLWNINKELQKTYPNIFKNKSDDNLSLFLNKSNLCKSILSTGSLPRALYICHVTTCDMRLKGIDSCFLFMLDHEWKIPIQTYAQKLGIQIIYLNHCLPINRPTTVTFSLNLYSLLRNHANELAYTIAPQLRSKILRKYRMFRSNYVERPLKDTSNKIAVYGKGSLNYENNGMHSDIIFAFGSQLKTDSLILLRVKGIKAVIQDFKKNNINYCCMKLPLDNINDINYYPGPHKVSKTNHYNYQDTTPLSLLEKRWLKYQEARYHFETSYWSEFVLKQNIKVFHTWYKYENDHIAIAESMRETGGVMSIWQMPFEEIPNVDNTILTDVSFTYSNVWTRSVEELQGSKISFHVSVGFIGPNYELVRPKAQALRKKLHAKGVKKIIACFDENSRDDERWHTGHNLQKKHYRLLLEKVLKHPWLGVIFKPKEPKTLRKRLAEVSFLLEEAEETGRCIVLDSTGLYASNVPVLLAGLAADVAIQGHMNAGTTALECALAGIPTLSVDLEGVRRSRIYELGERKVVFRTYEDLWETLQEHWNSKRGVPGFGDWDPLLDEMDQFRDNRGAERVGTYLHWLIQGFDQGKHRVQVLEEAAEKYCKQWGEDKISSVG
jgi:hypothetical protein